MDLKKAEKRYIPMSETMLYILLSLQEERHGYGVMLHVRELTDGRIVLGAGTIYQSIAKLQEDGLIESTEEIDRKKMYRIAGIGREILKIEARRISELYRNLEGLR